MSIDEKSTKQGIFCEIKALAVDHDYCKEGIAGNMVKLALENSKKLGYRALIAASSSSFLTKTLIDNNGTVE